MSVIEIVGKFKDRILGNTRVWDKGKKRVVVKKRYF